MEKDGEETQFRSNHGTKKTTSIEYALPLSASGGARSRIELAHETANTEHDDSPSDWHRPPIAARSVQNILAEQNRPGRQQKHFDDGMLLRQLDRIIGTCINEH